LQIFWGQIEKFDDQNLKNYNNEGF